MRPELAREEDGSEEREERWIQDREPRQVDGHVERLVPDLDAAFDQDAVLDVEMIVRRAELAAPSRADVERDLGSGDVVPEVVDDPPSGPDRTDLRDQLLIHGA